MLLEEWNGLNDNIMKLAFKIIDAKFTYERFEMKYQQSIYENNTYIYTLKYFLDLTNKDDSITLHSSTWNSDKKVIQDLKYSERFKNQ